MKRKVRVIGGPGRKPGLLERIFGSALQNGHKEDSDSDQGTDQDSDQVDDCVVEDIPCGDVAERLDVAPRDEVQPEQTDDKSDYGEENSVSLVLSFSEVCGENPSSDRHRSECDDDDGEELPDGPIHFLASDFRRAARRRPNFYNNAHH